MMLRDALPCLGLACSLTVALALGRLLPAGGAPVLVRLDEAGIARLFTDPGLRDIALLDRPAPGFAILRGDIGVIRSALGLPIAWKGWTSCATVR